MEGTPVRFRKDAAQPFDDRSLSWQIAERTVSVWTVRGRLQGIPFACSVEQAALLAASRRGESDLVWRGDCFYLHATCDVPSAPEYIPDGFVGWIWA